VPLSRKINSSPQAEKKQFLDIDSYHLAQQGGSLQALSDSIVENVNVWLDVIDTNLNILLWNRVAEVISGYTREEAVGHNRIWEILYPDEGYRQYIVTRTASLFQGGGELEHFETKIRCKSGEYKYISWNSCCLTDNAGNIYGGITFGYDITDRKRAEEALLKANREISALNNIVSVASASLDLDTILETSLQLVLTTMNSEEGLIHLKAENEDNLRVFAHQGIPEELLKQIECVPSNLGLIGWVYTHGQVVITSNIQGENGTPPPIWKSRDSAYMGVPMRAKGKVLGVFSVVCEKGRTFNQDEVSLLASIADQIGVAVENARLYQQAEQLATMKERIRLAYDLHDSVTQSLYSLTLLAEASKRQMNAGDLDRASEYITRLGETSLEALKEIRLLVYKLRPASLDKEGLMSAIQQRLGAVERRAGIKAHLIASDSLRLSPNIEEELYRVIQEALNNSLKHSKATSVSVRINQSEEFIEVEVRDNGIGFDQNMIGSSEGMGFKSMQERVKCIGGNIKITSTPGQGTIIYVKLSPEESGNFG
jgi:PAS domain S-box-containing protein